MHLCRFHVSLLASLAAGAKNLLKPFQVQMIIFKTIFKLPAYLLLLNL
jgi:hypothetical protein